MLDDLQLGEFIYEQPAVGDVEYTFKHALTQEVAYNSVLMERRGTSIVPAKPSKPFMRTISTITWQNWRITSPAAPTSIGRCTTWPCWQAVNSVACALCVGRGV